MWILVMFDIPTNNDGERFSYRLFRKFLLKNGFIMMQFSVYWRYTGNTANTNKYIKRIEQNIPLNGEVRILKFSDSLINNFLIWIFILVVPEKILNHHRINI